MDQYRAVVFGDRRKRSDEATNGKPFLMFLPSSLTEPISALFSALGFWLRRLEGYRAMSTPGRWRSTRLYEKSKYRPTRGADEFETVTVYALPPSHSDHLTGVVSRRTEAYGEFESGCLGYYRA